MTWNLVDNLTIPGLDRAFSLPLSSTPPGMPSLTMADASQFTLSDNINDTDYYSATKKPILTIAIQPSGSATTFPDIEGLPNPAIRLHAMAMGELYFEAANTTFTKDHLILKMPMFAWKFFAEVPWYERWHEGECIPYQLIYENIDTSFRDTLLSSIPIGGELNGVSFPSAVIDEATKNDFITKFKAGTEPLVVAAGAVIGKVTQVSDGSRSTATLMLHGRYARHSDASEDKAWPMNPREFFYLLFGDDSLESSGSTEDHSDRHPLMAALETKGGAQVADATDPLPAAKSMKLRPPLRTHKRLIWEASIEQTGAKTKWRSDGSLTDDHIYNRLTREDSVTGVVRVCDFGSDYSGENKCNVFGFDISLRSGFMACIIPFDATDGSKKWRYMTLLGINQAINKPVEGNDASTNERIPLMGAVEDKSKMWAYDIERQLEALPLFENDGSASTQRKEFLEKATEEQGRCLVFLVLKGSTGHFLLLKDALGPVVMAVDTKRTDDKGVRSIAATMMQAGVDSGASDWTDIFKVKDDKVGTIFIRSIELHPGGDPDHYWGLKDLNVLNTTKWD